MSAVTRMPERQLSPRDEFRETIESMAEPFARSLPSHIKPEKFQNVVLTAVFTDPGLLNADRASLLDAAMKAAQDGLLPDKREGAFVLFGNKVTWLPMIGGILKRVQQSGEIKMITARVVYGGDHFRTWIDDAGEHVEYEPGEDQDQSIIRRVFAMATTKEGAVYVEPLSAKDIEKIRNVSRAKNSGPWKDWWEEMAKKSAIRRLAKRLPLSVELHDLIQRDNELYDLSQAPEARPSLRERLATAKQNSITDAREGFDRDFIDAELGARLDKQEAASDPIEPETAEEGDLDPDTPAGELEAGAEEEQRELDMAASQPNRDPVVHSLLTECAAKMLEVATGAGEPSARQKTLVATKDAWKGELPNNLADLKRIVDRANSVITGKMNLPAAVTMLATELGLSEADIRPRVR